MQLLKLEVLVSVSSFVVLTFLQGILSYDKWNDIPCNADYQPENCNMNELYPLTVDDMDRCAPARLPLNTRNYYLGAAGRRDTYKDNKNAFRRVKIIPKVLRDVTRRELTTTVLGLEVDFPVGIAPVAAHKLAHPDGELATVAGLSGMKTVMILSTHATVSIEDVALRAKGTNIHLWMQTYIFKNRSLTVEIVERAQRSGFKAIVLTADGNVDGSLTCGGRTKLQFPDGVRLVNLGEQFLNIVEAGAEFWDIKWLKSVTSLPIIVKGILSGEDATRAIMAGASAILVSNHGGRQLDGAPATLDALSDVVEAVNRLFPRREVYLDGGVRSGQDVYKALARGAKMVFVGRPSVWGLALNGAEGVRQMMNILKSEFNETMLLSGNTSPSFIKRNSLLPQLPMFKVCAEANLE